MCCCCARQLMSLINSGGLPLFEKFVRHLSNYSIMQMVERLILHQPGWDRDGKPPDPSLSQTHIAMVG